jgi:putative tricarboxylic transport membrane protein
MRVAELVMAVCLAVFSIAVMWMSTDLPIGWIKGSGPGGGAFPFWLSGGMLLCCAGIIFRWYRRTSPPARSTDPFMSENGLKLFLIGAGSLTVMIGAIHFVGVYVAVPLFLIFYMRVLGRHSWALCAVVAVITPVVIFFFFEIALTITLPKGVTEPAFYPLYDIFL